MRLAAALVSAALCPAALAAQVPGIAPGDTVRFTSEIPWSARLPAAQRRQAPEELHGWRLAAVIRITPDSLLGVTPNANVPLAIHLDSIYALDVSRGRLPRSRNLRTWATVGAVAGLVAGAVINATDAGGSGQWTPTARLLGAGLLGWGIGAGVSFSRPGPYRWVQVRIPACRPRPGQLCLSNATTVEPAR